ncbi:hypothetical protein [Roseateles chitosanitabidus]|uniref:hypothetical protein n=1 Tax=Roseateles chitosanitabidus TaxID=65048 RepID=UPI001FE05744|nr:hypothetical protein [Roseateles chitosanitabidus]
MSRDDVQDPAPEREGVAAHVVATDAGLDDDVPMDDGDVAAQARIALETLAELDAGNGVSLPRLAKRTGMRVSVLLRLYTLMSDARVGAEQGPGWVRLHVDEDGRWIAHITPAGRGDEGPAP